MKKLFVLVFILIMKLAIADEGMWLTQIDSSLYKKLEELGLQIDPHKVFDFKNPDCLSKSVVSFNGSCSGVLISNKGLLLTNYHCCSSTLLKNIPNYEEVVKTKGYWAANESEEIPIPSLFVKKLWNIEDITDDILNCNTDLELELRVQKYLEEKKIQSDRFDYQIKTVLGGQCYILYSYKVFNDIRLVAVPPSLIARYGGEKTNWEWPRFSADFAMFRIYTNADHDCLEYAEENTPMYLSDFIPISLDGYKEDDFTMVMGYPGAGSPYENSEFIKLMAQKSYPLRKKLYEMKVNAIEKSINCNEDKSLLKRGLLNKIKMWTELIAVSERKKYVEKRSREEDELLKDILAEKICERIKNCQSKMLLNYEKMQIYSDAYDFYREGFEFVQIYRLVKQIASILKATKNDFNVLNNDNVLRKLQKLYNKIDLQEDINFFNAFIQLYVLKLDQEFQTKTCKENKLNITEWSNQILNDKIFCSYENFRKVIQENPNSILSSPLFLFVTEVEEFYNTKIWTVLPTISDQVNKLKKQYVSDLVLGIGKQNIWHEADRNFRFSYGKIKSYDLQGNNYGIQTNSKDFVKFECKNNFLNDELTDFLQTQKKKKSTPMCFIANCHTASGNSGSPVINAKGELIGLNFDRNQQGTISDLYFDAENFRNIAVDIRYILELVEATESNVYLRKEIQLH